MDARFGKTARYRGGPGKNGAPAAGERGIALILCLLLLAILIVLVTQFAYSAKVDELISRNSKDDAKGLFAARGALAYVRALLREDRKASPQVDSLREDWADPSALEAIAIGDASVKIELSDCERALNVNLLADEAARPFARGVLLHLLEKLGFETDKATEYAERIADYIDPDSEGDYEQGAKNAPLAAIEELANPRTGVREVPDEVFFGKPAEGDEPETKGLFSDPPLLTTWGSRKLNLNTIPDELVWAIFPDKVGSTTIDAAFRDDALEKVTEYRTGGEDAAAAAATPGAPPAATTGTTGDDEAKPGRDFERIEDLGTLIPQIAPALAPAAKSAPGAPSAPAPGGTAGGGAGAGGGAKPPKGLRDFLTVTSEDFRIFVTVARGAIRTSYEAILRRGTEQFHVLYWREVPE